MSPAKAKSVISINIQDFKKTVEEEWKGPSECKDFPEWFEVFEQHIESEIRGLQKMCFDEGEISLYPKYKEDLELEWRVTKRSLLELVESRCWFKKHN